MVRIPSFLGNNVILVGMPCQVFTAAFNFLVVVQYFDEFLNEADIYFFVYLASQIKSSKFTVLQRHIYKFSFGFGGANRFKPAISHSMIPKSDICFATDVLH